MHARDRFRRRILPATLTLALGASLGALVPGGAPSAAEAYDLVIQRGHVVDPKNRLDAVRDVAVKDGKIAKVARRIDAAAAKKTVDASGKVVTPGLIDLHAHLFPGPEGAYRNGWSGVAPDGFTFRSGVTTAVDAGSSGAKSFDLFKKNVIDRSQTRVLAFLNIVGEGMAGGRYEQDLKDMDPAPAAAKAEQHPGTIVGIKTAHYEGPEWTAVENSVKAGDAAGIPVMVDFGANRPERPLETLLTEKLRPGDIYSHAYSGLRGELGPDGKLNPGMKKGRDRGVLFDVGHGGGSFAYDVAVPAMKEGFTPDVISTDLHITSMNAGMKDQSNIMSKFMALGMPLKDVVNASTWVPAKAIQRPDLGNLSVGAPADIAVFTLDKGTFGFVDSFGFRIDGKRKLSTELTVRAGKVVWDLNGKAAQKWTPDPSRLTGRPHTH
ncbi:amidohydrolase/deacetylase family metallohydrolase [Actinomadura sp. KC06]|uniref:amidohydrolase/deacetylase family metallohydrolase n=1 Tax=Actinomadura sp. KC06 TaxID=2530369 RepID=UPI0010535360|nr:amidohydrolase/deacetylase family metallohydrolase [Actinomadura sp. KC06]TDD34153.1 amidohydrolase/deacetylase family metallohydrolase [Actinomadura sp. KC06]